MIRDLPGQPDQHVDNQHDKSAGHMRLWRQQRVEAAEAAPEFTQRKQRADRQCAGARKAAKPGRAGKRWEARDAIAPHDHRPEQAAVDATHLLP